LDSSVKAITINGADWPISDTVDAFIVPSVFLRGLASFSEASGLFQGNAAAAPPRTEATRLKVCLDSGQAETKMVGPENRSGAYVWVREHRKRRAPPFAGRHHLNINRP
jgi:hypothetical protein